MNVKITPSPLSGEITAPTSKSCAHRLIILACLAGKNSVIKNVGKSKDVSATINCMKALGADCRLSGEDLYINSFDKRKEAVLDCGESGSTLRFLLPVAAALGVKAQFTGTQKLLSRPSEPLINCLNGHGADIKDFCVNGKLKGGEFFIDAGVSSQYVSGLLMAFSVMGGKNKLTLTGKKVSAKYVDITVDALKTFGVKIKEEGASYTVEAEGLKGVGELCVEGDYSGAAFMLAAGALGGRVAVKGLNLNSKQGDEAIVDVLKLFGAKTHKAGGTVTVERRELNGINLDCEDVPDLVQIISAVAAFARGKTALYNIDRLKYKESDRIKAVEDMLKIAGIKTECDGKSLIIYGGKPKGGVFNSGNDHRTAMSCSVLALYAEGVSVIEDAKAVEKSYPDFYSDVKKLGGKADVLL